MSDSAGGGEGGGVAGTGQDTEADSEPPQQAPPVLGGDCIKVGVTPEEEAAPPAKRLRIMGEEQQQGVDEEPAMIQGETPAQADPAPPAQCKAPVHKHLFISFIKRSFWRSVRTGLN